MSIPGQPASDRPSLAPAWLDHLAALGWRVLVTVALAALVIWLALVLSTITASVLIAIIIAATFAPLATALRNRGWSRTKTAAVVTVGAILVITAVIVLIVLAFVPYVPDIVAGIQAGLTKAQADLAASGVSSTELTGVEAQAQAWLSDHISAIVGAVGTAVTIAILGGILLFFLLQDGDKAWVWCLQAMGDWQRERITSSGDDALQRVGGYLRGTALLAGAHAATDLVFLILLGVPLPAPLAVLVFFGGFIPYVGGLVTSLVVLGVAYAAIGAQGTFILLVLIVITNVILNNIVRPVVYGKTVHIHPAVVLIALPAGAAVAGVVGLFVAIPVVAFVTAVWGSVVAILEPEENSVANIGIVPGWLDRVAQWSWRLLIGAALLAFAIWLAVMLPLVVMPVVLAVVLAATFAPMVGALLRRGWGRGQAALTVTAGAFLIITAIMVLTSVVLVEQLQPIVAQAAAGATKIDTATNGALSSLSSTTDEATGSVVAVARSFSSGIAALTIVLVLATLLTFYFLRDGGVAWADWLQRLASWRRTEVDAAGRRAAGVLGGYMIGTGAISLFAAATQWFIMVLLGLPLALPLAVLAFFLGFIPYIGSIVATGLAFLVTFAVGSTQDIAIMAVFTIVFNIVQGNVVAPLVYGKAVNLHPAIVLMAIPAGAALAGIVGMFLAVPFIGVIAATWRTVLRLFGERPGDEATEPGPVAAPAPTPTPTPTADAPAPS